MNASERKESPAGPYRPLAELRREFPVLLQRVHGKPLVYLDNAATTQKPLVVSRAMSEYYEQYCSNVHRGLHQLSARATAAYEGARDKVRGFLGAADRREIVFTRGTTESINLVAQTLGLQRVRADDEILITEMEHHSNIVPWQMLAERTGAHLKVVPIDDAGELRMDEFERLLGPRTRLVAVVHTSNALGTRNPVERIVRLAHDNGTPVLLDAAQGVAHERIDVERLGCDFLAFSGHKLYGPTGIGVLYGKAELLEQLPPFLGGGEMIRSVTFAKTTYREVPYRFEAGTPNIAAAIGLGAAVDFVERAGLARVAESEAELLAYATRKIAALPGVRLIGTADRKAGILSFVFEGVHPHDLGTLLDLEGIAVRAGHHCAQPVMARYGVPATVRASLGLYNTRDEIDALVVGIEKGLEVFR